MFNKIAALRTVIATALLAVATVGQASAFDGLDFHLHNRSDVSVIGFFFAPAGTDRWVAVRGSVLEPGRWTTVSVSGSYNTCEYDLVADLSNGHRLVNHDVNLCKVTDIYV